MAYPYRVMMPLRSNYMHEVDTSEELGHEHASNYQSLVGS